MMKERNVWIAHNPSSNRNLSSGIAPIKEYISDGLKIGLATDVAAGSYLSIFRAMEDAINASKIRSALIDKKHKSVTLKEVFYLETLDGGIEIINKRKKIIEELKNTIYDIHFFISDTKEKIKTVYENNIDENDFSKKSKQNREKDLKFLTMTVGPQRDDIKFIIENVDIRKFGSQGQQRTAALSINLAELNSIKEKKEETPILLLDDVFSELDETRQKLLIKK